jgi:hypothetical protein
MTPNERQPMLERLRGRLSYANVVATLALFIALGGSSYAALTVTGKNVRNGSLTGKDVKRNSLTGRQIREGRLDSVPFARNSARVGGLTAQQLLDKCPPGTLPAADVCIETQARPAQIYSAAVFTCGVVDTPQTPGRRLPTHGELSKAFTDPAFGAITAGGELTSDVFPSSVRPGRVAVLYLTDQLGGIGVAEDQAADAKAFRCVADPGN